jgi:hypothetical protein
MPTLHEVTTVESEISDLSEAENESNVTSEVTVIESKNAETEESAKSKLHYTFIFNIYQYFLN